jgi:hypothetical protein
MQGQVVSLSMQGREEWGGGERGNAAFNDADLLVTFFRFSSALALSPAR